MYHPLFLLIADAWRFSQPVWRDHHDGTRTRQTFTNAAQQGAGTTWLKREHG